MKSEVVAIFLAAGSSRRMGNKNKLLLPYQGQLLVQHTYGQLCQSEVENIVVVTGFEHKRMEMALKDFQPNYVYNTQYHTGMTSSIQTGLRSLHESQSLMICLSDMPFLTTFDYNQLLQAFHQHYQQQPLIIRPSINGRVGNPVIFSPHFHPTILAHQEPEGCKGILKKHPKAIISIELKNPFAFEDVDTEEAYKRLF